ncbi:lebercilin isoform X1 [Stegostoma tigrinum]|uniref:lebercilin isoform X1 n=1 Tax=Stegostoma tigrinum TaxID=3053191 RepID=UPI00202B522C|nr:lebercilin isoform X1 [Stegostoma tigrinum]XP_048387297.1 lebercilin isoform X1 [Stegostoma tigrinum]XP_048387298.1 lebercilin isoform X1 [Stegostoma tigrinum]XP_048387299.1 lebercilin isoform X1 [Stegostoma tigrinum]
MESQNGYFEDITVDSESERSPHSGRASTQSKFVTNGNNSFSDNAKKINLPQSTDSTMRDQGKTKKNMDYDKNSDSYYSDDYDDSSYTSDQCCSEYSASRTPSPSRKGQAKQKKSSNPSQNQANRKSGSKHPANHGSRRWGSRTQSLSKESVHKDIDLVTKRMLSARLLKINELRNEVTELQAKLEDLQKENKILKRLQYRQERALNKFEDTENEIAMLISHHNDEVRVLRERLRKSQEKERAVEKRLKDTEEELYRTKSTLQKLKKLSEDKHLVERDELAQKLAKAEIKMEESERKLKELERNLELTNHSFLRQVASERKKVHVAQENIQNLQDTIQCLGQKLKEKEKELDVKNIYANRILKASPKKDTESVPKKKATVLNTAIGVQTEEYFLPLEFPTPPLVISGEDELTIKGEYSQTIQEHHDSETLELTDHLQRDKDLQEHKREPEEMRKREQEQHRLELKAQKLREKWEQEEQERKREEKESVVKESSSRETEHQNVEKMNEKRKKEILLAKMREIDEETNGSSVTSPHNASHLFSTEMSKSRDSPERLQKTGDFLKSVDNTLTEGCGRRGTRTTSFSDELSFGMYAPSFGKGTGRSGLIGQKSKGKGEQLNGYYDLPFKDRKSNLMEQLFGTGAATDITTKEENFLMSYAVDQTKGSDNPFPWEQTNKYTRKNDSGDSVSSGGMISSNHHHSKYASIKPAVNVIDSLEDEVEEVIL